MNLNYSWLNEWDIKPVAGGHQSGARRDRVPENRCPLGFAYSLDRWTADWTINYIDQVVDGNDPARTTSPRMEHPLPRNANTCAARFYHNAQVGFDFTSSIQAFGGVANLLDQDPCILGQITQYGDTGINTNASLYDVTGRNFYVGVRARL